MSNPIHRRGFLGRTVAGAGWVVVSGGRTGGRLAGAATPAGPAAESAGLTTYQLGPQIWVRWNNRLITGYRAHRSQKYPYLYPVAGPATGQSLTAETSLPYPHHRSLFFGCDRINGGNYWQEGFEQGQVLSAGPRLGTVSGTSAEILDACEWRRPGGPVVMTDQRRILVTVRDAGLYTIDWEMDWKAVEAVAIEKTNHSLFAIRAEPELTPPMGGVLRNARGDVGEKGTFGKAAEWCAFQGRRQGPTGPVVEGIAVLDHPANPWSPCPWFTRDYGFLSPTPFFFREAPWSLPAGQSVRLRYRVLMYAGPAEEAGIPERYREWTG